MTEVLDAGAVIVGSPTLNNNIFPTVMDFLTYMKGLKPKNKIGAAFGSYGWSGEAVKLINQELQAMDMDLPDEGIRMQYVPNPENLEACHALGKKIGKALTP
jgi:flavorubredoxin